MTYTFNKDKLVIAKLDTYETEKYISNKIINLV